MRFYLAGFVLLSVMGTAAICSPDPYRVSELDPTDRPDAQLNVMLVDQLNEEWSLHYLQVYSNGWLIWQGVPPRGDGLIARNLPIHSGERELSIRVKAAPRDPAHGHLVTKREVFVLRPSLQTLRIVLNENIFYPEELDVELAAR